ncbi:hypothetical protein PVAND_008853 [Polypedilum vanderplanki]|uniref:Uncharacterized protein n=1 Tax=Polypedilum vanderplanki TaxID=319348 RepID=A0A9J6CB37_POLVA|nr:hypothetical protein PVAND_008853 [Polypedilum vanderplanki]
MLISSSRLVHRTKRLFHVTKSFNKQLETKNDVKDKYKEKLMQISAFTVERYNQIIGFDEIDKEYRKVTALQEELAKIQGKRTNLQLQINQIQKNLTSLQSQIQDCRRGEARYIELMKKEFEVIQEKNNLEEKFDIVDQNERELFAHLQAKINILHEKSRTHTKQWGVITSILGATLGVICTGISAYFRNNDIRRVQQNFQNQFKEQIAIITSDMEKITKGYTDLIEFLQQKEIVKETKNEKKESWASYIGKKTVAVWRWCTFQKSS